VSTDDGGFGQRMARVETLIAEAERFADPTARAVTRDIVAALLELHGAGLARALDLLAGGGDTGRVALEAYTADGLIASLLLLHGLHPIDLDTRVRRALDSVRPSLASHGGGVELLGVEDGIIRLRLEGNCNGCPSSGDTLRGLVETALDEAAPDRAGLEVMAADLPPPSRLFSLPLVGDVAVGARG
jgi:Fe-S cluster biogenesis protein NfuA